MKKILTIFGTRPEAIKLAPVVQQMELRRDAFRTINISSGQHRDILKPFVNTFGLRIDHDLEVMSPNQTPTSVCARVMDLIDPILDDTKPDLILVQGDTTTALAGALAGFHRRIPVGHVEAGLRSGDCQSPFPEEMNRRLITQLATYHFAATSRNRERLMAEGVSEQRVFVTGNPVVDALKTILAATTPSSATQKVIDSTEGLKRIVLTTHRRESFGEMMAANLKVISTFVENHLDVALIFPVHPNPEVVRTAMRVLHGRPRIQLLGPQDYSDFIYMLSRSWLIVSDSGGIQEEAPTLRKPLLILRENTERPEAVECGVAKLVGGNPARLGRLLEETYQNGDWLQKVNEMRNPFGEGDSGQRIVSIIAELKQAPEVMTKMEVCQ